MFQLASSAPTTREHGPFCPILYKCGAGCSTMTYDASVMNKLTLHCITDIMCVSAVTLGNVSGPMRSFNSTPTRFRHVAPTFLLLKQLLYLFANVSSMLVY